MGVMAAIRRRFSSASSPEQLPVSDPYVNALTAANRRDRFVITPEPVTRTAAGPGFDDPNITVDGSTYPYDYASWSNTDA